MATTHIGTIRHGKLEIDAPADLPEGSQVCITLSPIIDEKSACHKANKWLMKYVGNVSTKRQGVLFQADDQRLWRFTAFVTSVGAKPIGPVGQVDVDADTGQIRSPENTIEQLTAHLAQLAPLP